MTDQFHPMLVAFAFWKAQVLPYAALPSFEEAQNCVAGASFVKP
jgi:hypothetical protein